MMSEISQNFVTIYYKLSTETTGRHLRIIEQSIFNNRQGYPDSKRNLMFKGLKKKKESNFS